ncbi:MAG: alpha/beta hydrolase [Burkholderiales bacterium]|nr:alpha/beta hydrolase [Burkholderiales bacterium]
MLTMQRQLIKIPCDGRKIEGMLELPEHPVGVVLFAHGSGSSRFSPRNNYVAAVLHGARIASVLLDLLTPEEDQDYQMRFDIALLAQRLDGAYQYLRQQEKTRRLPIALFGASTGAAAALRLAARRGTEIAAVVSRGGRPDLAGEEILASVSAPTLLIVGGDDQVVIELNRLAYQAMQCEKRLDIVPGATHLFEEPGKLQVVAKLAVEWVQSHLAAANEQAGPGSH